MDTIEPVFSKNMKSLIWGQVELQVFSVPVVKLQQLAQQDRVCNRSSILGVIGVVYGAIIIGQTVLHIY